MRTLFIAAFFVGSAARSVRLIFQLHVLRDLVALSGVEIFDELELDHCHLVYPDSE